MYAIKTISYINRLLPLQYNASILGSNLNGIAQLSNTSHMYEAQQDVTADQQQKHQQQTPDQKPETVTVDKIEYDRLVEQVQLIDNKYKLSLADMENLRARLKRELDDSKKFAISKFCKDLIEVTDVMQIALKQIKPEDVGQANYDGFKMIETRTRDIFSKHGLICLRPTGVKFDPNEHHAVFEVPDASKEPGTVSEVCKEGWKLHDRILRPAIVGVVKKS